MSDYSVAGSTFPGKLQGTKAKRLHKKRNGPPKDQPWVWLTRELLESDAWRTAPLNTRRIVDRLILEHMHHAGQENGNLICTYDDFVRYGIRRASIKGALKDAIKRGLVYQSQQGKAAPGLAGRCPNIFGLGWLPGNDASAAHNRWKAYKRGDIHRDIYSSTGSGTILNGRNTPKGEFMGRNKVPEVVPEMVEYSSGRGTEIKNPALPVDWSVRKAEADGRSRIHNADGVALPCVEHPLVGTPEQQRALAEYNACERSHAGQDLETALERLSQARKEKER